MNLERAKTSVQSAQEILDRRLFDETEARRAQVDWGNYLNPLPDHGSPMMQGKLTDLFNATAQAVLDTRSAREMVSNFQKALDKATGDLAFAQDAHGKIVEERTRPANEIPKIVSN